MIATPGLSSVQLHPAGKQTIAGMVAKGWIEMQMDANGGARYRITPDGEAALKAKIPSSGR
jgi:DNA-binding PadR family transcriptional regulator